MQTIFCQFIWIAISFCGFFSPTLFSIAVAIVAAPLRPLFNQQERDHCRYSQVRITRRKMVCNTFVTDTSFFFYQMMTIYHPYMIVYCYGPSIWDLRSFPNIQRWPSAQPLLCWVQAADSGEEFICFFFYCSIYSGWMTAALRNAQAWLRSLEKGNRKSFSFM